MQVTYTKEVKLIKSISINLSQRINNSSAHGLLSAVKLYEIMR